MKHCNGCDQDKPLDKFPKKGNGYQSKCLVCRRQMNKDWYERNKDATYKRNKRTRERLIKWYRSLKDGPCVDCGVQYPFYQMEWDHLPEYDKSGDIMKILNQTWNKQRVLEEIEKCELVCVLCHRERTYQRRCALGELADPPDSESGFL